MDILGIIHQHPECIKKFDAKIIVGNDLFKFVSLDKMKEQIANSIIKQLLDEKAIDVTTTELEDNCTKISARLLIIDRNEVLKFKK